MALSLEQMVEEVREGLEKQLRVRGPSLEVQVRKAGRRLPRAVRRDATYLAQTVGLAGNPKLAKMVDMQKAVRAHRNVLAFLKTVDLGAARRDLALQSMASIAFVVLVTAALVLFVLVQRGFV